MPALFVIAVDEHSEALLERLLPQGCVYAAVEIEGQEWALPAAQLAHILTAMTARVQHRWREVTRSGGDNAA